MAALPLDNVSAIKVYLGLPLFGWRMPRSGSDSIAQRQAQDFALRVYQPVVMGAANELPAVERALQERRCLHYGDRIGLFGFSAGGAAVLYALAERDVAVDAAVILNAPVSLTENISALEQATHTPYTWTGAARALAIQSDSIRRADDIARSDPPPALLIIQGTGDSVVAGAGARALSHALEPYYRHSHSNERLRLETPDIPHNWSASANRRMLEVAVANWFARF